MIELVGILLLSVGEGNSTKIADEWRSAAHEFVKQCEMSENLLGSHAPQDSNRIRQMLLGDTPAHVTWHIEENGRRKLVMDIYFQVGELHIINHVDGLNLVTNAGKIYEWDRNKESGIVIEASGVELIEYLIYRTDPVGYMSSLYRMQRLYPQMFEDPVKLKGGAVELRMKPDARRESGIPVLAITVQEVPLTYLGMELQGEKGEVIKWFFSRPKSIPSIPKNVYSAIDGVSFEKSNLKLERHIQYP